MASKFVVFCLMLSIAKIAADYDFNNSNSNGSNGNTQSDGSLHGHSNFQNKAQNAAAHTNKDDDSQAQNYNYQDNSQYPPHGYSYETQQQSQRYNAEHNFSGDNAGEHQFSAFAQQAEPTYNPPAKYEYSYDVHDDYTGDIKSHAEMRDGYYVRGAYSVVDPDGFKRTVTYTVDGPSGFNAVVNREPYAVKTAVPPEAASKSTTSAANSGDAQLPQPTRGAPTHIDLPLQGRESYAPLPKASHNAEGPYH